MIDVVPRLPQCNKWSGARVIVAVNFLLIATGLVLDRVGGTTADLALRRAGVDTVVALSLQLWLASSTLLATGFFVSSLFRRRQAGTDLARLRRKLMMDGALLLLWWLTVLGACAYAFMLGMAG